MAEPFISCALISTDQELTSKLKNVLVPSCGIDLAFEISEPFSQITPEHLDSIHVANPEVILIDLESNPQLGVRFAATLSELEPGWKLVAIGSAEPDPLLVISAMRSGVSEYLTKPFSENEFIRAVSITDRDKRRSAIRRSDEHSALGEVLVVFGVKGGCGSTTIATNLAIEMHRISKKKVVIVDLDFVLGEVSLFLKVEPRFDFVDLANNLHRMENGIISSYIDVHTSGVSVVIAPREPDKARGLPLESVEKTIAMLRNYYDYVVIDGTNSLDTRLLKVMEAAQSLYMILDLDVPSLRNARQSLPVLEKVMGKELGKLNIILNRYSEESIPDSEVERLLKIKPFYRLRDEGRLLAASINMGKPAVLEGRTEWAKEVSGLASKIVGVEVVPAKKKGWFPKLFK